MGSVQDLPKPWKRGAAYYFQYRNRAGKRIQVSTGSGTVKGAKTFMLDYFAKLERGRTEASFREYAAPFWTWDTDPHVARLMADAEDPDKPPVSQKYVYDSGNIFKRWIMTDPDFPGLPLRDITRGDVEDLKGRLLQRCPSRRTAQAALKTVKVILSEAYHRQDISENPGRSVALPRVKAKPRPVLTPEELGILFREGLPADADPLERAYFSFLIGTGTRVTEARMIQWQDLDLDARTVHLHRSVKWNKERTIALPAAVVERLKAWQKLTPYRQPEHLVFATLHREGLQPGGTWVRKHFAATLDRVSTPQKGEPEPALILDGREPTPHALRKSINMLLLGSSASAISIIAFLGWTDEATAHLAEAQTHYTELQLIDTAACAKAINAALTGSTARKAAIRRA